jgi:hypothetical protein
VKNSDERDERTGWKDVEEWPAEPPTEVLCRRQMRPVLVEEHLRCPYCFGARADVESGRHAGFCGYEQEKDPLHFGFPPEGVRDKHG